MTAYLALLRKQPDSDYGVDFPDFPGCVTAGTTLEDARRMAAEAIRFHVEGMIEDGEPIPAPSRLDEIMADPNHRDAVAVLPAPRPYPGVARQYRAWVKAVSRCSTTRPTFQIACERDLPTPTPTRYRPPQQIPGESTECAVSNESC